MRRRGVVDVIESVINLSLNGACLRGYIQIASKINACSVRGTIRCLGLPGWVYMSTVKTEYHPPRNVPTIQAVSMRD